jgi:hypothetical protein
MIMQQNRKNICGVAAILFAFLPKKEEKTL